MKTAKQIVKEFASEIREYQIPDAEAKKPEHWEFTEAYSFFVTGSAYSYLHQLDKAFIGTENYLGFAYFWGQEYKHILRDCNQKQRQRIHGSWVEAGLELLGDSPEHYAIIEKYANNLSLITWKHC